MQLSLNWERAMYGSRSARGAREWLRQPAAGTAMFLLALAMLLLWRRIAGAIHEPLPLAGIAFAGIFLALLAGITHWIGNFLRIELHSGAAADLSDSTDALTECSTVKQAGNGTLHSIATHKRHAALLLDIALSLSLFAVAAVLSMPGTSAVGLMLCWLILLAEESIYYGQKRWFSAGAKNFACFPEGAAFSEPWGTTKVSNAVAARQEQHPPECPPEFTSERAKNYLEIDEELLPEEVTQQLTRSTAADGTEELTGWLRISFVVGQRTKNAHLAFCPPFAHMPELSVEQLDGPEARIKTAQLLPYGARLDLKLHSAVESTAAVVLHFTARAEGAKNRGM